MLNMLLQHVVENVLEKEWYDIDKNIELDEKNLQISY